ncbi:MAG: hypothetical protein M1816_004814 [Peltula sp. TS41687]|nr:MAG: hypothetical protein M1816_004814 [Peltula sp. TS41687]
MTPPSTSSSRSSSAHSISAECFHASFVTEQVDYVEIPAALKGLETFYNRKTETVNLLAISTSPGDFNASRNVAYWTPQKETADRLQYQKPSQVPWIRNTFGLEVETAPRIFGE